jgi:hypothetical protein
MMGMMDVRAQDITTRQWISNEMRWLGSNNKQCNMKYETMERQ